MRYTHLLFIIAALLTTACNNQEDDGKLANGMLCTDNSECKSNNCYNKICMDASSAKTEDGDACSSNLECQSGYCNKDGVCGPRPQIVAKKAYGEACNENEECLSDYCHPDKKRCSSQQQTAINVEKKENGSSCYTPLGCISGYCNNYLGVCVDKKDKDKKIPAGGDCMNSKYCESNVCVPATSKCAIVPGSIGAPCDEHSDCDNYYCEEDSKTCQIMPPQPDGTDCIYHVDCQSGYCSEGFPGSCMTPSEDVCTLNSDCVKYHNDYSCAPSHEHNNIKLCRKLEVGETCSTHAECNSGLCLPNSKRCGITSFTEFQCSDDDDCKDKGENLTCSVSIGYCTLKNPCEFHECEGDEESCYFGKCIGPDTLELEGKPCMDSTNDYCLLNLALSCDKGVIKLTNCEAEGLGICSYVGGKAKCVGFQRSWAKCYDSIASGVNETNVCTTDNRGRYHALCTEDINGWLVSVPIEDIVSCQQSKECKYDATQDNDAVCM